MYPSYATGCGALLMKQVDALLPDMNTALAALAKPAAGGAVPSIVRRMGRLRTVDAPTVGILYFGDEPPGALGNQDFLKTVRFQILFLVPQIADDLPENFEIARQVAGDALTCMLDDAPMLTPVVNASPATGGGPFASVPAALASRSALTDVGEFVMADGVTAAEGFVLYWTAQFAVSRHT